MAPNARVEQPRRAAIPSLVLYTMGVPGTNHTTTASSLQVYARSCLPADVAKMVHDARQKEHESAS
jgi:hypothetical protein